MSDLLSLFFRSHTLITLTTPVTSSCYLFRFFFLHGSAASYFWVREGKGGGLGGNGGWMEDKERGGVAEK